MSGEVIRLLRGEPVEEVTRRSRRGLVVFLYGTWVAAVGAQLWLVPALAARMSAGVWLVVHLLGFLLVIVLLAAAFYSNVLATRSVAEQRRSLLDERDATVAGGAYRPAFLIMTLFVLASVLLLTVLRDFGTLSDGHFQIVFWTGLLLHHTLPTSVVAWTEPDPPAEIAELHSYPGRSS